MLRSDTSHTPRDANNLLHDRDGFTLIELMTVMGIIFIIVAIAVPALIGVRDKSRLTSMTASAKGAVTEIQSILDKVTQDEPFITTDATLREICVERQGISIQKSCGAIYNKNTDATYQNVDEVIGHIINSYRGRSVTSPFDSNNLLFSSTVKAGSIVLTSPNASSIKIEAYSKNTTTPFFVTTVTVK